MNYSKYYRTFFVIIGIILFLGIVYLFLPEAKGEEYIENLYQEAKEAYYSGNLDNAIKKYKEILRYQPGSRAALYLATIYEELGNYAMAKEQYKSYLHNNPMDLEVQLDLAIADFNLGNLDISKKGLTKVLTSQDVNPYLKREAAYYLSKISTMMGNYSEALQYVNQAIKADLRYVLAVVQKGWIYELMDQPEEAIKYYLNALRLDGSLKGIQRRLGLLYLKIKDYDNAYYHFDRALSENKKDQLSKEKLNWLEQKFPGRFKRLSTPPTPEDLPKKVTFRQVTPLTDDEKIKLIRVGLFGGEPQKVIFFRVGADFRVEDRNGTLLTTGRTGEIWKVEQKKGYYELVKYPEGKIVKFTGPIKVKTEKYAPILIHQVQFGKGYFWAGKEDRQYRGQVEFLPKTNGLTLVNILNVEEYLYSVIASEMPASWPIEALKAQTVAARTYTYYNLGKHSSEGFDLCDTVHCAAYNGIGWESHKTHKAVQETLGLIMTFNGRPINAVYSANSGGHTEDVKDVWGTDLPYLKGVSTLKSENETIFPLEPAELKSWLRKVPESYSLEPQFSNPVHYRWQRRVSRSFIEDRLNIGRLQELKVTGRGRGGSVTSILAVGTKGQVELKHSLRSKLGGLRSNRFFIRPEYENGQLTAFVFYGGGWGHNVGMDQVAAAGMAKEGFTFDQILKHFYTGIELTKLY
ncbi:hypothetical protein BBF96_04050 [Anoxybacter fermentans]|uniref:Sporulation stage II protein D amidase enhancer LytB N-terminal domain-containing protein n=1 Tax=Anoxybacter fermentans TaxID=1323375 RepID=A0A3S9SWM1_9FIRM|nr:SpoIID/LytB domain-containing protein [Anoxybacter fermentans]AZR72632.1 hypothetical protein BBF96_04050 [Anoxybacter fermentans]